MAFFRRKTKDSCEDSTALLTGDSADKNKATPGSKNAAKDKNIAKTFFRDMTEWIIIFVICFGGFYFFTFTDKERAYHKKQMDVQLEELAKQFEAQKTSLTTQLDGLYQQLFAAEQATKEAAVTVDTQPEAEPAVSAEQQQLQAEIDHKKAELEAKQKKVNSFCAYCPFNFGGLRTTCGKRRDYILNTYGGEPDSATLAVIEWVPSCAN